MVDSDQLAGNVEHSERRPGEKLGLDCVFCRVGHIMIQITILDSRVGRFGAVLFYSGYGQSYL